MNNSFYNKQILITGGCGFIGRKLAESLISKGSYVKVLDNLSPQIHGVKFERELLHPDVELIIGDVSNKQDWSSALEGVDGVFHLAAETGTGQSMYQTSRYTEVNCTGTSHLLDLVQSGDVSLEKLVVASSRSVYGEGAYQCSQHGATYGVSRSASAMTQGRFEPLCPICGSDMTVLPTSELVPVNPVSIYALTKYFQEVACITTSSRIFRGVTALRFQNVYGPGQSLKNPYTGILSIFSVRLLKNQNINIFEDGLESRDFVYIDDVVDSLLRAYSSTNSDGEVFNVGSGVATSVLDVVGHLKTNYQSSSDVSVSGEYRIGDIRHNIADISAIQNRLEWNPRVAFAEGVANFCDWVRQQELIEDGYTDSLQQLRDRGLLKK